MKKWLAMLLAMMMVFALAACGNTNNKGNDAKEFARGSWAENVYTNDSLGLTVTVPENWEIADDEELAELMTDEPCPPLHRRKRCPEERNCLECWAEWLKMEAEESANVNQENEI